jgi:DNA-binding GntR family transcriptional regulator
LELLVMDSKTGPLVASDPLRVSTVTVQAQTVSKLRDAILSGVFKPGERLIETDLCERMGVSRTSIREALRRLEAERLVTIQPNRGPSVTEITWTQAQQIYEVRALLEGEAAALFASRAAEGDIRALKESLQRFQKADATGDALERLSATTQFYEIILNGCGNEIIAELLNGLVARITFLRARSMSQAGRGRKSAAEMQAMFQAIASRKATAAREAAVAHVSAAAEAARQVFSIQGSVRRETSSPLVTGSRTRPRVA